MGEQCLSGDRIEGGRQLAVAERPLNGVYTFLDIRKPDGSYDPEMLSEVRINYITHVKESSMPLAVSNPYQRLQGDDFVWANGQTTISVAESGRRYHKAAAALDRVEVEVAEGRSTTPRTLRPGFLKMMISPQISAADAPLEIARQENLAGTDMVRLHQADTDEEGNVRGKFMPTVALPALPLAVWHATIYDLGEKIGKRIEVADKESALEVMKLHSELEFPTEALPEGIVSVVEHLLPHLNREMRLRVEAQLLVMRDQEAQAFMHQKAESIADRWMEFDMALGDSLCAGRATPQIETFVFSLSHEWDDEALGLIAANSLPDGGIRMTTKLATKLAKACQNTLWTSAAVATGNEAVLRKLSPRAAQAIHDNEVLIEAARFNGYSPAQIAALQAQNNRLIAQQNIIVGGGCGGFTDGGFGGSKQNDPTSNRDLLLTNREREEAQRKIQENNEEDTSAIRYKTGVCRIEKCPTRPGKTEVGPCVVCRRCQRIFDMGGHPDQIAATPYVREKPSEPAAKENGIQWLSIISQASGKRAKKQDAPHDSQKEFSLAA